VRPSARAGLCTPGFCARDRPGRNGSPATGQPAPGQPEEQPLALVGGVERLLDKAPPHPLRTWSLAGSSGLALYLRSPMARDRLRLPFTLHARCVGDRGGAGWCGAHCGGGGAGVSLVAKRGRVGGAGPHALPAGNMTPPLPSPS